MLGEEMLNPYQNGSGLREGEVLYTILSIGTWILITPIIFWLTPRISPERIKWPGAILAIIGLGICVAVVVDFIDHILWNTIIPDASPRTLSVLFILDNFHFLNDFFIYLAVLIAGFARAYFLRFQDQQKEAVQLRMDSARLQTNLAEARIRALRMQINPHFLFNTLHIISDHFEEDPRSARRMIARLSDILRYTFEGTETKEVPLHDEMQFLDGYLDIQHYRFEDRLLVQTDIAANVQDALVPTLILQPLVENAIKHGVSQIEGQGIIEIKAWKDAATLNLSVADNGPGKSHSNGRNGSSAGIGLRNTRERLEMLYGENQTFTTQPLASGGFIASITLPYHTSDDYQLSVVEAQH